MHNSSCYWKISLKIIHFIFSLWMELDFLKISILLSEGTINDNIIITRLWIFYYTWEYIPLLLELFIYEYPYTFLVNLRCNWNVTIFFFSSSNLNCLGPIWCLRVNMMKRNKDGTGLKGPHSHLLPFMVLECAMQPAGVGNALMVISSCEFREVQYQPAWRNVSVHLCSHGRTDRCNHSHYDCVWSPF